MPNVKPGDIARVVGPHQPSDMPLVGVTRLFSNFWPMAKVWRCVALSHVGGIDRVNLTPTIVPPGTILAISDEYLIPLRDEGEDDNDKKVVPVESPNEVHN
jgi:hypothetical protein